MFPEGNVPGYVCNPGSPRERDAASQGHTSGIPTRAMLHSWKLAPAAHHVLLSILVMTSPHLTSDRQFWLITHMIQSWTTLMAFPIASRHSVSFPRGTRVTYVTWDDFLHHDYVVYEIMSVCMCVKRFIIIYNCIYIVVINCGWMMDGTVRVARDGDWVVLTSHFYRSHKGSWNSTVNLCRLCALYCGLTVLKLIW